MTDARKVLVPDAIDGDNQDEENLTAQEQSLEQPATDTAPELPEKYRGKSVQEIIEMHQNAERALGTKNNELGQWRSLTQQLIDSKAEADRGDEDLDDDLSSDDLFDNAREAIRRVVERELSQRLAPVEQSIQQDRLSKAEQALLSKHEDAVDVTNSNEFIEWVQRSPRRQRAAQAASQGDLEAADDLLETFKEIRGSRSTAVTEPTAEKPRRTSGVDAARRVATGRGGTSAAISNQKTYDASDLARLINTDPSKYNSKEFQSELRTAIKEGRVRGL